MLCVRHRSNLDDAPRRTLCLFFPTPFAGKINALAVSADGLTMATTSEDKALKIYDIVNFG